MNKTCVPNAHRWACQALLPPTLWLWRLGTHSCKLLDFDVLSVPAPERERRTPDGSGTRETLCLVNWSTYFTSFIAYFLASREASIWLICITLRHKASLSLNFLHPSFCSQSMARSFKACVFCCEKVSLSLSLSLSLFENPSPPDLTDMFYSSRVIKFQMKMILQGLQDSQGKRPSVKRCDC
jgi:hypothetical protein